MTFQHFPNFCRKTKLNLSIMISSLGEITSKKSSSVLIYKVLIFCVEIWELSHSTHDLSQAEKKINVFTSWRFIFFSAWDKSHVKWDNSQNSIQKMRIKVGMYHWSEKRTPRTFWVTDSLHNFWMLSWVGMDHWSEERLGWLMKEFSVGVLAFL